MILAPLFFICSQDIPLKTSIVTLIFKFCVDDVEKGKPAPDLFLSAARQIQTEPENCIVIEDSPHGIKGAVAAGMSVVGFVGGSHLKGKTDVHAQVLREAGATEVFHSLSAISRFIFEWNAKNKTKARNFA